METAEELANEKYYDIPYPKNIASVDDYTTNEIRLLQRTAYVAGYTETTRWTKLSDDVPTVEKNGEKVLIFRLLNDGQSNQNPSIYPTKLIHVCNPAETWWMEIPKLPI